MQRTHQDLTWVTLAGCDRLGALRWLVAQLRWEARLAELERA
jgi:hypothetical protein